MYMMKSFNNLELNGTRKGFIVGGVIVLIKKINLLIIIVLYLQNYNKIIKDIIYLNQ